MQIIYEKFILKYGFLRNCAFDQIMVQKLCPPDLKHYINLLDITTFRTTVYKQSSNSLTKRCNIIIIIIYLYCRHMVHIHIKKMLNIYKNSNKNNNNIISQSKIVLINITLISTIAEWESEYKQ